jgi:HD-like signal output (HDOD) protein
MTDANLQVLFQEVLDRVLKDDVRLPSIPDVAMKVRSAISKDNTTVDSLTAIIAKDPALTAYLVRAASSPIYRRAMPPKTLSEVVGLLGFAATDSLVMIHSSRNMVAINNTGARALFNHTWERLVVKTSVASFLAQQLKFRPVEQVQMAMLLTEVGSLSVLSTMLDASETPDSGIYFQMCRQYSKQIGSAALTKWEVEKTIIDVLNDCGQWNKTWSENLNLLDIANLALYYTVQMTSENPKLPDVDSIAAYQKIPEEMRYCSKPNWLDLVTDNNDEIQAIISAFK